MIRCLFLLLVLVACSPVPKSAAYREFYSHLQNVPAQPYWHDEPYYIVFLVNARHLDYSNCQGFLRTLAKHPSDGTKTGDVGHAWIFLKSKECFLEGGFSGEIGEWQPRYWEGVLENLLLGGDDPVSYLWCPQCDGFFQSGNGGHQPTFAAKVNITKDQYDKILAFIQSYPFSEYSITGRQCSSFVREVGELIGIDLEDTVTLKIDQYVFFEARYWKMWSNPCYSELTFSSPDQLERSLMKLVSEGKAENALGWYKRTHKTCYGCEWKRMQETVTLLPMRLLRFYSVQQTPDCPENIPSCEDHCLHISESP